MSPRGKRAGTDRERGVVTGGGDYWETPVPPIRAGCKVCRVTFEDVQLGRVLVSPTGMAHYQREGGYEDTRCGKYAALDGWWWPL